jgi:NAD(P)H-nitrite reductase large subunit
MHYVIIGNGIAGVSAAEAIRQLDSQGSITMIADEAHPPYSRPMISLVLEGSVTPEALAIRDPNFFSDMRIDPVLGSRVQNIDVVEKTVSTEAGKTIRFDKLLIASGADPRPIAAEQCDLDHIFFMRTEAHVRDMLSALDKTRHALVLGGGLVGFKAAYGLLRRGIKVTMLIKSDYPLSMQADEIAGKMILKELLREGLTVKVGVEVLAFEGRDGRVAVAHTSNGEEIVCELVVVGKGVLPALDFVPREQVEIDLGIMVNAHMETNIVGIFAAGDCAEAFDLSRQCRWVNAIWPEAVQQGRLAGLNMAGRRVAGKGSMGRNVMRIFNMDIMTGGLVTPPEDQGYEVIAMLDQAGDVYRKLVLKDNRLAGMVMVRHVEQGGVWLAMINSGTPLQVAPERLLEPGFNYRRILI